ncbi:hypothetical protein KCU99_g9065, partial [Aureobasidium melanogenum]
MRSTTLATFPLFSLALGAVNWSAFESCVTSSGTASVKTVSTSVSTTTIQQPDVLIKHTFHPQHLFTPLPFTKFWTHTFQETDTAVSTVTIQLTHTEFVPTSTIVNTYTQTQVSSVFTTVPTPAGFLPISDTTNSAYPNGQSLSSSSASASTSSAVSSQSSSAPAAASITASIGFNVTASASGVGASADGSVDLEARNPKNPIKQFAHAVHCLKSVLVQKTINTTITGTTQTSTLAQATVTATVSATATIQVLPKFGHGNTIYTTAYTTVTKGYNVYSNKFVTAEVTSTSTAYAACQTNNILNSVASVNGQAKFKTTVASSAEQCCEQCQQSSNCIGSAFQALLPLGGRCLIYYANTCPAQSANALQYTPAAIKQLPGTYALSNGACGYMFSVVEQAFGQSLGHAHGHGW